MWIGWASGGSAPGRWGFAMEDQRIEGVVAGSEGLMDSGSDGGARS